MRPPSRGARRWSSGSGCTWGTGSTFHRLAARLPGLRRHLPGGHAGVGGRRNGQAAHRGGGVRDSHRESSAWRICPPPPTKQEEPSGRRCNSFTWANVSFLPRPSQPLHPQLRETLCFLFTSLPPSLLVLQDRRSAVEHPILRSSPRQENTPPPPPPLPSFKSTSITAKNFFTSDSAPPAAAEQGYPGAEEGICGGDHCGE